MEEDNPMPLIVFLLSIIKTTPYKSKFVFSPSQCLNTIYKDIIFIEKILTYVHMY